MRDHETVSLYLNPFDCSPFILISYLVSEKVRIGFNGDAQIRFEPFTKSDRLYFGD